jgi:para-aminobenzoate synthetase component 1
MAAGGGIVIDSICEDEYQECFTKIAAIVSGLS